MEENCNDLSGRHEHSDPVFPIGEQMQEILRSHGVEGNLQNRTLVSLDDVGS